MILVFKNQIIFFKKVVKAVLFNALYDSEILAYVD